MTLPSGPPPTLERDLELARRLIRVGQHDGAIESLRRVLAEDPDHAEAHALLSLVLLGQRRLHAAGYEADAALALEPHAPLSLLASANVLIARRRLGEAEERLLELRRVAPGMAEGLRRLAGLRSLQGRREEAGELLAEALRLDPEDVGVLTDLGEWHLEQGRLDAAEDLAQRALEMEPESPDALVLQGHVLLRRGDLEAAREHALWALRSDPADPASLHLLTAIKARRNPVLGLWWRYSVWMGSFGDGRIILVLLVAYALYRFAVITADHLGQPGLAGAVSFAWLAIVAYTWFGPALFERSLRKELAQVELRDF